MLAVGVGVRGEGVAAEVEAEGLGEGGEEGVGWGGVGGLEVGFVRWWVGLGGPDVGC